MTDLERYNEFVEANNPVLTVFILSSSRVNLLTKMVESVISTNKYYYPIFVLDNLSKDGTKEMLESRVSNNFFYFERASTPSAGNYLYAFDICKTKYMVIFHDDDILGDNYFDIMTNFIINHPDADVISCDTQSIDYSDQPLVEATSKYKSSAKSDVEYYVYKNHSYFRKILSRSHDGLNIMFPTAIYKKSFFTDISVFLSNDYGQAGDVYLWFQVERLGGTIYALNKKLYLYRVHPNQNSFINAGLMEKVFIEALLNDPYYSKIDEFNDTNVSMFLKATFKAMLLSYSRNKNKREELRKSFDFDARLFALGKICKRLKLFFRFAQLFPLLSSKVMVFADMLYKLKRRLFE